MGEMILHRSKAKSTTPAQHFRDYCEFVLQNGVTKQLVAHLANYSTGIIADEALAKRILAQAVRAAS
jgi:hypothetical protein